MCKSGRERQNKTRSLTHSVCFSTAAATKTLCSPLQHSLHCEVRTYVTRDLQHTRHCHCALCGMVRERVRTLFLFSYILLSILLQSVSTDYYSTYVGQLLIQSIMHSFVNSCMNVSTGDTSFISYKNNE